MATKGVPYSWEIFQPDGIDVSTDILRYSSLGAPPGLHSFYVCTCILFDMLHGLHNVCPLSMQKCFIV